MHGKDLILVVVELMIVFDPAFMLLSLFLDDFNKWCALCLRWANGFLDVRAEVHTEVVGIKDGCTLA